MNKLMTYLLYTYNLIPLFKLYGTKVVSECIDAPFKSLISRLIMIYLIVIEKYNYNDLVQVNKLITY